ncbi:MAG: hypothetical protein ACRDT6_23470 [Micromonosporaceae bacterium]
MKRASSWSTLLGWWVADDGKTVLLEQIGCESLVVTVAPERGAESYVGAELLGGGLKRIERVRAQPQRTKRGHWYLEIEAGTDAVGPTYRLYPAQGGHGTWQPVSQVIAGAVSALLPEVHIGLYDDWEDDLGVPWAFPLLPLMRSARPT